MVLDKNGTVLTRIWGVRARRVQGGSRGAAGEQRGGKGAAGRGWLTQNRR